MKSHPLIPGVLVIGCGVSGYTQIMQRARTRLEPPTAIAYLLVTRYPHAQAAIAIPA